MAISWPGALRIVAYAPPRLENTDRSGGVTLAGGEQIIESPSARWAMQVTCIVNDPASLLAWHSLAARLRGRSGEILMPVTACITQPGGVTLTEFEGSGGGLTRFDSGAAFVGEEHAGALLTSVGVNATVLHITTTADLQVGHYLGVGDRLHFITGFSRSVDDYLVTISPWTREAYAAGAAIAFRLAVCRMRLKDPSQLLQPLDLGRFARPTLDFVEAF